MSPTVISELQQRWGTRLDETIKKQLQKRAELAPFYCMMSYQLGYVDAALQPVTSSGGKRFRPFLCLLTCQAARGEATRAFEPAASIELLHNFSLVHDDIEDHDPSRRHRATVWKVWGEPQAINVGDGLFAVCAITMLQASVDDATSLALTRRLEETALRLTEGQFLDMSFETRYRVSPEEYLRMIKLKTGALVAFSAWAGAMVAQQPQIADSLHTFGLELGKAFQIRDDVMGIWAPSELTGKVEAQDLENRKKTLPVLYAIERAEGAKGKELERYYTRTSNDTNAVVEILSETRAREHCVAEAERHLDAAYMALRGADLEPASCSMLERLADELGSLTA